MPSSRKGRRARVPLGVCCSVRQYAYHAIPVFSVPLPGTNIPSRGETVGYGSLNLGRKGGTTTRERLLLRPNSYYFGTQGNCNHFVACRIGPREEITQ